MGACEHRCKLPSSHYLPRVPNAAFIAAPTTSLLPHSHPPGSCDQDMSRLGRDMLRCVLVDDTPLAFYFQPDHGVPVLQVGDPDEHAAAYVGSSWTGCWNIADGM